MSEISLGKNREVMTSEEASNFVPNGELEVPSTSKSNGSPIGAIPLENRYEANSSSDPDPQTQTIVFTEMRVDDLAEVELIELAVYEHPWSMGNFQDSLVSGYDCWIGRTANGCVAGYFLLMHTPDESHLLNVTVARHLQGAGIGKRLLELAFERARAHGLLAILLEVRPSNPHALAIYRHLGFHQIGIRKGYYPAAGKRREDAIVMRLTLQAAP